MSEQQQQQCSEEKQKGITVVIAMDGSEFSSYALDFYAECLHRPGNKVVVVHVSELRCITYPAVAVMTGATDATIVTKELRAEEERATSLSKSLEEKMKQLKIEDGAVARTHGEPGPAIITICNEQNASYVVVGCRGKSTVRKTFTGSVTDYVTHHSHVPVIVARHKDHLEKHHRRFSLSKKHDNKGVKDVNEGTTSPPTSPTQ